MTKSQHNLALASFGLCGCLLAATVYVGISSVPAFSQDDTGTAQTPADNSNMNQRDRSSQELTADQAGQQLSDRDMMQKIRKSVMQDKSLSSYAHNIKIISTNGMVTLKGPVRSQDEKQKVLHKATVIAGSKKVIDQISIKPVSP